MFGRDTIENNPGADNRVACHCKVRQLEEFCCLSQAKWLMTTLVVIGIYFSSLQ